MELKQNDPRKYNEFRVVLQDGKIFDKTLTKRASVSIKPSEAKYLNSTTNQTKLYYELAEQDETDKSERDLVEDEATKLGVKFDKRLSTDKLKERIELVKNSK